MSSPRVTVTERGICPDCSRSYRLDTKGRLQDHPYPQDPRSTVHVPGRCEGSRTPPKESSR